MQQSRPATPAKRRYAIKTVWLYRDKTFCQFIRDRSGRVQIWNDESPAKNDADAIRRLLPSGTRLEIVDCN